MTFDLRLGDWRQVLATEEVSCLISDPPYGARTHEATAERGDGYDKAGLRPDYAAWTAKDVAAFVKSWSPRVRGWMCVLTSHDLVPAWEKAYEKADRYCFAPLPVVMPGMSVRMLGDGPSSWSVSLVVARPKTKEFMSWGTLPGFYKSAPGREAGGGRGKPMEIMNAIVRDYSRKGDLVCDPMAGHGTTLAAALANDRRAIGSEVDADAHKEALRRLARPLQVDLFATTGAA